MAAAGPRRADAHPRRPPRRPSPATTTSRSRSTSGVILPRTRSTARRGGSCHSTGRAAAWTAPEGAYLAYADGRVAVSTGCNSGSAEVEITDDTITFGPMALTRMACVGDVMAFETALVRNARWPLGVHARVGRAHAVERRVDAHPAADPLSRVPRRGTGRAVAAGGFRCDGIGAGHAMDAFDLHAEVIEVRDECDHRRLVGHVQHDSAPTSVDRSLTDELRQPFVERALNAAVDLDIEARLMPHLLCSTVRRRLVSGYTRRRVNARRVRPHPGLLWRCGHGQ